MIPATERDPLLEIEGPCCDSHLRKEHARSSAFFVYRCPDCGRTFNRDELATYALGLRAVELLASDEVCIEDALRALAQRLEVRL